MHVRAILMAILLACGLTGALLLLGKVLEVGALGAPQFLVLFGLWLLPGYLAATRATDAGILHGLLTGLLGMIVIFIGMALAANLHILPFDPYNQKSPLIFIILAGFWGSIGGMIVDIVRLIKARRVVNEAKNHPSGSA